VEGGDQAPPTRDLIARRAYELFLARGAQHGRHLDDWLSAERELQTPVVAAAATRRARSRTPRSAASADRPSSKRR
jgi:hypothetical protein